MTTRIAERFDGSRRDELRQLVAAGRISNLNRVTEKGALVAIEPDAADLRIGYGYSVYADVAVNDEA